TPFQCCTQVGPNLSLNAEVPRRPAARSSSRRLACFVRRIRSDLAISPDTFSQLFLEALTYGRFLESANRARSRRRVQPLGRRARWRRTHLSFWAGRRAAGWIAAELDLGAS